MEQLSFPVEPLPDRQCRWQKQNDHRLAKQDDPFVCQFVADSGSIYCQKHSLIAEQFGSEEPIAIYASERKELREV